MKKIFTLVCVMALAATSSMAQVRIGGRSIDTRRAAAAVADVATAITLSDEDVARICREAVEWMDEHNPIADETTEYGARLRRLTDGLESYDGLELNFKVYHVIDVNAFACADGSVRVFSSLMDLMTDDELLGIIGHEIGHIKNQDTKDAIKNAYLTSAARNAAGAAGGTVGKLSDSQLGDLVSAFSDARYSQKQEYEADDYGFRFLCDRGADPYGMALSLEKLVELSQGEKASTVQKMFSTHPDSENRAKRVRERADQYVASRQD